MGKLLLFFVGLLFSGASCPGQTSSNRILFVIDSIPLLKDPEEWNQLLEGDISDIRVINSRDTLKLLGFKKFEGVTYIFTKEYRNRTDSLKKIPSLKQMEMKNDAWVFRDIPYSGTYIDYYNNGKKQNEGILLNGKLDGEYRIYFKNGSLAKQGFFLKGVNTGEEISYYESGVVSNRIKYLDGKIFRLQHYFPNGQLEYGNLSEKGDTAISYFSTGEIKKIAIIKNGMVVNDPIVEKINYYQNQVYQSSREGDFKNGLKYCNKIIELDILNETAYFYKGEFLEKLNYLDEAIAEYDKALKIEPLLGYVLTSRAFARIKKYEMLNNGVTTLPSKQNAIIPDGDIEKICADLHQAVYCGKSDKRITEAISNYCEKNINH